MRKFERSLRVDGDHSAQDFHEVWLVISLLAVGNNFVELLGFDKAHDNFIRRACILVDFKSHLGVVLPYDVTEGVRHGLDFL